MLEGSRAMPLRARSSQFGRCLDSRSAVTIPAVLRQRSFHTAKFDLTKTCPKCGYKIQPDDLLLLSFERMRCPRCQQDMPIPRSRDSAMTAVPIRRN